MPLFFASNNRKFLNKVQHKNVKVGRQYDVFFEYVREVLRWVSLKQQESYFLRNYETSCKIVIVVSA
jgi:hypothetical protein